MDDLLADAQSAPAESGPSVMSAPPGRDSDGAEEDTQGQSGSGADLGPLSTPAGVGGCLEALGAQGEVPLAVDLATYQGEPAAVIVLPSDREGVDVWVVTRTCAPGDDGLQQFTHLDP